ncbi:MAG: sulfatase [Chloroflexi bacterium]|nr:sulfatase [Chloroflexota bacterium]
MSAPNIIFVLLDDLGWRDLGCCGSTFYETPCLDRLAAEGLRFTNAYAASPVCSPARASFLTGRYPARVGVTNYIGREHPSRGRLIDAPYVDHLPLEEKSLARALGEAGYATWHVGKWHLGEEPYWPDRHGFDVNIGGCDWGSPKQGYFAPWGIPTLAEGEPGEYLTDRLTDEAIALIRAHDASRPFFLNLWYYAVHNPMQPKPELRKKYEAKAKRLGLDEVDPFEVGDFFPCDHKKDQRIIRRRIQSDPRYAAMVETVDGNIGRLLDALREAGQYENTIVVFTSDNGGLSTAEGSPTCNAPLSEGKGWLYDGGTREPFLVLWPGVTAPGAVCETPISGPDLYPTLLEAAGLDPLPEQHCDGVSLVPLLRGEPTAEHVLNERALFWHYPHYGNQGGTPGASVRWGDWKAIAFYEDGRLELYNLAADIGEEHDLAAERPDIAERLRGMLHEWQESVGARHPLPVEGA